MFQKYYGFTSLPFTKTIPTKDLFPTAGQKELAARLTYLLRERGCGLVTGEIGSGKSTAVRTFTAGLDPNRYLVIYLSNPHDRDDRPLPRLALQPRSRASLHQLAHGRPHP